MTKRFPVLFMLVLMCFIVKAQQSPNIVLFLVDDMGWQDTSVPFWKEETALNRRYHTPNMERLAKDGVMLTQAYVTPVCTPTRTSLMTGVNAAHHHITNWTNIHQGGNSDKPDSIYAMTVWNHDGMSTLKGTPHTFYATALPALLNENGYFTIHVGKAHWGSMGTPASNPHNLGFMVNVAGSAIGRPQSFRGTDNFGNLPDKTTFHAVQGLSEYYGSEVFLTEALTREAIKTLDAPLRNGQPFFLHMAHYAVHTPIQDDPRFYQKYRDAGLNETEARYASMVEGMDKSLGDIMDFLKARNAERNTVIIFMSDNGGLSLTPPRGGEVHTHNHPLRAGKGSVYEGGIRVPMIVKWPGVIKAGTTADQYVMVEDLFPTLLDIAGVKKYKTVQSVDGKSFMPLLKDASYRDQSRCLIWHFPNKWQLQDGPGINYKSAIRQGDWKLVYHMRSGQLELFKISEDISESSDLSRQYPEKVRALAAHLSTALRKWDAPMPVVKATGKAVPFPDEL